MSTMNARYAGKCTCARSFPLGAVIEYDRALRRVVACPGCNPQAAALTDSGAEVFTNRAGRCEDAPCCGCCS